MLSRPVLSQRKKPATRKCRKFHRRSAGDKGARTGGRQTRDNQFPGASSLSDMAEEVDLPPHRLHLRLISSCSHGPAGRSFFMAFVSNRPQAGGYSGRLQRFGISDDLAEISCARRVSVTSSQRNEHVRAFNKSRAHVHGHSRFRGICLGVSAECFTAIAPACSP